MSIGAQWLESLSSLHSTYSGHSDSLFLDGDLKNVAVQGWLDRHQFSWLALVCLMRGLELGFRVRSGVRGKCVIEQEGWSLKPET